MRAGIEITFVGLMTFVLGPGCLSNADPRSDGIEEVEQHKNAKKVDDSEEPKYPGRIYVYGSLDVSAGGNRYYGIYQEIRDNGRVVEASGIVLMPWDNRPDVSLVHEGKVIPDTRVEIGDKETRFPGRPLLLATGGKLKVVANAIPFSSYGSSARMERAVKDLLTKHATSDK